MYEATRQVLTKTKAPPGLITELDPDAPLRQNKVLHDQDVEDEQRLYRCVFELVRAGKVLKAQKLAMGQGYFMLAAGMQGWKAFRGNIRGLYASSLEIESSMPTSKGSRSERHGESSLDDLKLPSSSSSTSGQCGTLRFHLIGACFRRGRRSAAR